MYRMRPYALVCLALFAAGLPATSLADAPSFTAAQAAKGKTLYLDHCASCHGARLEGEHISPALAGDRFDRTWRLEEGMGVEHKSTQPRPPTKTLARRWDSAVG